MKITLPKNVCILIDRLEEAGFSAFAVGGCIRDSLLGREVNDWDITTSASPKEVKKIFSHTIDTGIEHGTVTVLLQGEAFEVTTFRVDGDYLDGRHPQSVKFSTDLEEDLKRRDFTINAMAYNERKGIVDPFGGQKDLSKGVISCVGDPIERFTEDALRIMRCVRFSAQLGFSIEEKTYRAMKQLSSRLSMVSAERIRTELMKTLSSDHPDRFRLFYETGQTAVFLPEFDLCMETPQNSRYHCMNVGEHTLKAVSEIENVPHLRLAELLHDIGKPKTRYRDKKGTDHFPDHQEAGAEMANGILRRLKFDNRTRERVVRLVRFHDENPDLDDPAEVRKTVSLIGPDLFPELFSIKRADTKAKSPAVAEEQLAYIDRFERMYGEIRENGDCLQIRDLAIDGKDLMEEGLSSGKKIGEALSEALKLVLADPEKNRKDTLLHSLKQMGLLCMAFILLFTGCAKPSFSSKKEVTEAVTESEPEETESEEGSAALPSSLLTFVDTSDRKLGVTDLSSGKESVIPYTDGTMYYDKYGGLSYLAAFSPGEVVNLSVSSYGTVKSLQVDKSALRVEGLTDYQIDEKEGVFSFEGQSYRMSPEVPVYLGEEDVTLSGIGEGDELTAVLLDKDVAALRITTGFGTIVLKNTERL